MEYIFLVIITIAVIAVGYSIYDSTHSFQIR